MKIGITYDTAEMYLKSETDDLHFDFALSFAGEDRAVVEEIALELKKTGYQVFYDDDHTHSLAGKDLYRYLRNCYKNRCKFVVCFISKNYSEKIWTTLEMTAIKERLMETFFADDFLIPIILDNSEMIEDIPSFLGFYKHKTVEESADLLIKKIKSTLNEDILINGVDKFIDYLCVKLYHNLKNKINCITKINNTISIVLDGKTNSYTFESDKRGFTKSVLIRKNQANSDLILPEYLIHWDKKNRLNFTIYNFNINSKKIKEEKSFNELIKYLSELMMIN